MYQNFKQWFLAVMFPLQYGGVYIPFPDVMQEEDYPIADMIYWLMRHGESGKDFRLYMPVSGWPVGVRILDRQVATMFKLRFQV